MSVGIFANTARLHELSVVAAAQATRDGSLTSVAHATVLLHGYSDLAHFNAFIMVE